MNTTTLLLLIKWHRDSRRDARRERKAGMLDLASWSDGRASAFLLSARQVKGWETKAVGVNYVKRQRMAA